MRFDNLFPPTLVYVFHVCWSFFFFFFFFFTNITDISATFKFCSHAQNKITKLKKTSVELLSEPDTVDDWIITRTNFQIVALKVQEISKIARKITRTNVVFVQTIGNDKVQTTELKLSQFWTKCHYRFIMISCCCFCLFWFAYFIFRNYSKTYHIHLRASTSLELSWFVFLPFFFRVTFHAF